MKLLCFKICLLAVVLSAIAPLTFAQEYRAALLGTVTDPTGAAVVSAKVIATNIETAVSVPTEANAEGNYLIPFLTPGNYNLRVEHTGFKTFERGPIQLRVNERVRLDVRLELGATTESVTVTGAVPLLETESSLSGAVMETKSISAVPVNGYKVYQLMYYVPGLSTVGYNSFSSLGQSDRAFGYSVDGISAKEPVRGVVTDHTKVMMPSIESIAEVKVVTTGTPAEFGHSAAGMLTTVLKSGTNQLHGTAEDRMSFRQLTHRQFYDLLPLQDPNWGHAFAGSFGGPVYLPKVYNGKNRTFFLVGIQWGYSKTGWTGISDVPSAAMLNGDFTFNGLGKQIYDPLTTTQNAAGTWIRQPFTGNKIPTSRFDPVTKNFLSNKPWFPENAAGYTDTNGPHQNLVNSVDKILNRPYVDAKIDHQISSANRISGRYSGNFLRQFDRTADPPIQWDLVSTAVAYPVITMHNVVLSDVYTINPSTVNEFRVGYNGRIANLQPASRGQNWGKTLGIPNVAADSFPAFRTASGGQYYGVGGESAYREVGEDITMQENFTKIVGAHTFKTGYELIRSRFNSTNGLLPSGQYNMGGTDMPFTPNTGNDFAALLLGSVSSATYTRPAATWLPRWLSHGLYIQDDFKVSKDLTLNYGLRWSYESPFNTKYGQQTQFSPTAIDPVSKLPGALVHPKSALSSRDLNNFQPRVGLAWHFLPGLVFRGSFSLVTVDLLADSKDQSFEEYSATASVQPPAGDPRIAFLLSQGPPSITFNSNPDGSVPFVGTNYSGRSATWFDSNIRSPYVMNWAGGFQWQFAPTWLTEFNYQGSSGVRLRGSVDANTLPKSIYDSTDRTLLDKVYQAGQNYKPFTQFGSVTYITNLAHNTYHGLLARVEKRYARGLIIQGSWTWSKTMSGSGGSGWAYYNWDLSKARASVDLNHRLLAIATYQLPFGKGRQFMNGGGWKDLLLGGWDLGAYQMGQSGRPFTVTFAGSSSRYLPGPSRAIQTVPNNQAQVQGWTLGAHRFPADAQNPYLNFSAFQYPAAYTPGPLGANTFTGPKLIWAQGTLSKQFVFKERYRVSVKWEISNPYKHNNFVLPGSVPYNALTPNSFAKSFSMFDNMGSIGGRLYQNITLRMDF